MTWTQALRQVLKGQPISIKQTNRFHLGPTHPNKHLTLRETEIVLNLLLGRTCKETARAMQLSPRTIEYYIRNMKAKLSCHTRSELLDSVLNSDFLQNISIETYA